ncbi:MAG TPA: TIGR01777 family oxidoreductase [Mucilaginibacter sp.]|nr:TIGR01777 family oxidoreductase [Mucilaginibacter sp.]
MREPNSAIYRPSILITGGSGLVGTLLTDKLLSLNHKVNHLSRKPGTGDDVKTYLWDVDKGEIDESCIDGVEMIVHLAGAGIADKKWTDERKREITESRSESIRLIYDVLKKTRNKVNTVISASAIGYYGDRGDELLTEDSNPGEGFMPQCCIEWEKAVDEGKQLGLRVVKFRTGVLLDKNDGALPQMAKPVKLFAGAAFGSGKQWVPWIHGRDVVRMYMHAIENINVTGVYNMVAPEPVTNKQLIRAVAKQLHRPLWPIKAPAAFFRLLLGEMSTLVLGSTRVSAQRILDDGFIFQYPHLDEALNDIYG